jgi:hypothetical protein
MEFVLFEVVSLTPNHQPGGPEYISSSGSPLDLSGLGGPTSSYAPVGIALRVSGALEPHHHDKVGVASVGRELLSLSKIPSTLIEIEVLLSGKI